MLGIESLELNRIVEIIFYLGFLFASFNALEAIDYSKIIRKGFEGRAIIIHTLLSVGLAYLCAKFFLTIIYS